MKARDRKAIKRQVSRELASQKSAIQNEIRSGKAVMEKEIREHIKAFETKQICATYSLPGNIPAYAYVEYGEKDIMLGIARDLARCLIDSGMIEIENRYSPVRGDIEVRATVNVYADQRKRYREGTLMTLGHIGW